MSWWQISSSANKKHTEPWKQIYRKVLLFKLFLSFYNCILELVLSVNIFSLDTFEPYGMSAESASLYSEGSSSYVPPSPYMSAGM